MKSHQTESIFRSDIMKIFILMDFCFAGIFILLNRISFWYEQGYGYVRCKSSPACLRLDHQPPSRRFAIGPAPQPQPSIMLPESDTPGNQLNP